MYVHGATFDGHSGPANAVRWTSSGEYFFSASGDKTIKLWNPHGDASGCLVKAYSGVHGHAVRDVCIFHDNTRFASAGDDRTVYLWDVSTGAIAKRISAHNSPTNALALNAQSTVLLSASYDRTVRLWDLRTAARDPLQQLSDFQDSVTSVQVFLDHFVLTGCVDGVLRTYDLRKGLLHEDNLSGGKNACQSASIACSRAFTSSLTSKKSEPAALSLCMPVLNSGSSVKEGNIVVSSLRSGKRLASFGTGVGANSIIQTECCLLHGNVAVGCEDGSVRLWSVEGVPLQSLAESSGELSAPSAILSVDAHPSRSILLSGAHNGRVRLWYEAEEKNSCFSS